MRRLAMLIIHGAVLALTMSISAAASPLPSASPVISSTVAIAARSPVTGFTSRVSVASDGTEGNGNSSVDDVGPSISSNGRYTAFSSNASNLVPNDTNGIADVFVHDSLTRGTFRVSVATDATQGNGSSYAAFISSDGRYVVFSSSANNLVPDDTNGFIDTFVHDRQTGQTTRVSVASDGAQGNNDSRAGPIAPDGRYVAFYSSATNLVPEDTNGAQDVFVHDRIIGQTTLVSVSSDDGQGNGNSWHSSISSDGRYIAFQSSASNLVPGDTNGYQDVFVRDQQLQTTVRVSVATDGTQGNGGSGAARISANGQFVVFSSNSTNLVPGRTGNGVMYDALIHNMQTGETSRVSVTSDGTPANGWSMPGSVSADGRYVAFESLATNLVPGDTNGVNDVFVHDRETGETVRASVSSDGTQGNYASQASSISDDGRHVVFESQANTLVHGDTNAWRDVFIRNLGPFPYEYFQPIIFKGYTGGP